jgi:EF hand
MNQHTPHTRATWGTAFTAALAVTAAAWALPAMSANDTLKDAAKDSAPGQRMQATAASKADAAAAFKRADANADGKLSKEEAASLPAIAARFDEFDKDKDGFLSMDEFMAATTAPN